MRILTTVNGVLSAVGLSLFVCSTSVANAASELILLACLVVNVYLDLTQDDYVRV